jgi:hypothetical protein
MLRELAKAYPEREFYGIDPFIEDGHTFGHQGLAKPGELMLRQQQICRENAKLPNITLLEETSKRFAESLAEAAVVLMNISCVFVDGNHHYEHVDNDCHLAVRLLPKGGVIFFDDLDEPGVARAVKELRLREEGRIVADDDRRIVRLKAL